MYKNKTTAIFVTWLRKITLKILFLRSKYNLGHDLKFGIVGTSENSLCNRQVKADT